MQQASSKNWLMKRFIGDNQYFKFTGNQYSSQSSSNIIWGKCNTKENQDAITLLQFPSGFQAQHCSKLKQIVIKAWVSDYEQDLPSQKQIQSLHKITKASESCLSALSTPVQETNIAGIPVMLLYCYQKY